MAGVTRFPKHLCSLRSGLTNQNAKAKERKDKIEKELSLSEGSRYVSCCWREKQKKKEVEEEVEVEAGDSSADSRFSTGQIPD